VNEEKVITMPLRRRAESHVANQVIEREMRELHARLDAMEIVKGGHLMLETSVM
jgi:hypothetical protein